jgi:TonB family protein
MFSLPVATNFARYLNAMHARIHPQFTDRFLKSLSSLPCEHPLNERQLVTRLEVVLAPDGRVQRIGVVRPSTEPDFDIAALDSVDRAQPFGATPASIRSPDGLFYMHWEFHRDEIYACSTMGVRPFLLRSQDEMP